MAVKVARACLAATLGLLLLAQWASAADPPARLIVAPFDTRAFPELQTTVSVLNATGIPVTGLTNANFESVEDGKSVPITSVEQVQTNQGGVGVVLGLDVSGSMDGQPLTDAVAALTGFVNKLSPADQVGALRFGGKCVVETGPGMTGERGPVRDFVQSAKAAGDTPLYDAALASVQMSLQGAPGRRMVVILTDGEDTCSKVSQDTLVAAAVRNSVPLYFIGLGPELKPEVLQRLATLTGGAYFAAENSSQLAGIYEELAKRMRTAYTVRYRSAQAADRKEHVVVLRVKTEAGEVTSEARFTPPAIAPTPRLSLTPNQKIAAPTRVEVTTTAPVQLTRAEFFLDDGLVYTATAPPLAYEIVPFDRPAGSHTLRVRVVDSGGGDADARLPLDFERLPPRVKLSVVPNQRLEEPTRVEVTNTAPLRLSRVEFYLDDKALETQTSGPFAYTLDPRGMGTGRHTLKVRAIDSRGDADDATVPLEFGSSGLVPFWVIIAFALALPVVVVVAIFLRAGRRKLRCPRCHRRLEQGWTACPYCAPPAAADEVVASGADLTPARPTIAAGMPVASAAGRGLAASIINGSSTVAGNGPATVVGAAPPLAGPATSQGGSGRTRVLSTPPAPGWLIVSDGQQPGMRFRLTDTETTIGRDSDNDIVLDDLNCSRQHAKVQRSGAAYELTDLGTTNGTFVNGRRVSRQRLRFGDEVRIGETKMTLVPRPADVG